MNGLTFDIKPGQVAAIVGSSGAGKSTIVGLLQRFYDVTSGEICIDGVSLKDLNVKWIRSQIGLVSQEPVLFGVSIAENIMYGKRDATRADVEEAAKQANAHNFIIKLPMVRVRIIGELREIVVFCCAKFGAGFLLNFIFLGLRHVSRRHRISVVWRTKTTDCHR